MDQRTRDLLSRSCDQDVVRRFEKFYHAVNARAEWQSGLRESYDAPDEALGAEVEYFHPVITYDDRMRYICEHIVTNQRTSSRNRVGNTIISHFYGARGIHQVLTGDQNPSTALVDFELVDAERRSGRLDYTIEMRRRAEEARAAGKPLWGTTELHTSIQQAGKSFVRENHGEQAVTQFATCEWIASWIGDGTVDRILGVKNFRELYDVFRSKRGVGSYYGYHGAASSSNNPEIAAYQDERFCDPGPGAVETAKLMFPGVSVKEASLEDRVIWLREHQHDIMDSPVIHESRHNLSVGGVEIYPEPQDELKTYGTEVCMCQFSVYERLRSNPSLISKRKVARMETTSSLDQFF